MKNDEHIVLGNNEENPDKICEECRKEDESVRSNLIIMKNDEHIVLQNNEGKPDNICEECKKEDESVKQNLIMHSYKICNSCNLAKTLFPI